MGEVERIHNHLPYLEQRLIHSATNRMRQSEKRTEATQLYTPILDNIVDMYGKPLKNTILANARQKRKKVTIIRSVPGVGKTDYAADLGHAYQAIDMELGLDEKTARPIHISFDEVLQHMKDYYEFPRSQARWSLAQWKKFSFVMYYKLLTNISSGGEKRIIMETNSWGVNPGEDRAQSTMVMFCNFLRLHPKLIDEVDMDFIVPDHLIQRKSRTEREIVAQIADLSRVRARLAKEFKVDVINLDEYIMSLPETYLQKLPGYKEYKNGMPNVLEGTLLKIQSAKAAPKERQEMYDKEWEQEVDRRYTAQEFTYDHLNASVYDKNRSILDRIRYKANAAYTELFMKEMLGDDLLHIGKVVLNPDNPKMRRIRDAAKWIAN